jgi:hypothetical protein
MEVVNRQTVDHFITSRAMSERILDAVRRTIAGDPHATFASRLAWACADTYAGEIMGIVILSSRCFYLNGITYCNFFGQDLNEFEDFRGECFFMYADLEDMCSESIRGGAWEKYRLMCGHHFPEVSDFTFYLGEVAIEAYNELGVSHKSVEDVIYGR